MGQGKKQNKTTTKANRKQNQYLLFSSFLLSACANVYGRVEHKL